MTVIAWDGKTLAADGRITLDGDITSDTFNKIHKLTGMEYLGDELLVIGFSGAVVDLLKLIEYLKTEVYLTSEIEHSIHAIVVGRKYLYETNHDSGFMIRYPKKDKLATGSGRPFAQSALSLGLDAKAAVQHAMKHNVFCGGKVTTWTSKENKHD